MPRYIVERIFPDGLHIPMTSDGAESCLGVVEGNAGNGVTWVHSYVNPQKTRTYCVYDGPDAESIRKAANSTRLPVERITEVRVLDPYFYY